MDLDLLRRRRSIVLTAALTVIAMSGALIGATLKTREQITPQEERKKKQENAEKDIDQQITLLESSRARLVRQRDAVADKVQEIKQKAKKREELERERKRTAEKLRAGR